MGKGRDKRRRRNKTGGIRKGKCVSCKRPTWYNGSNVERPTCHDCLGTSKHQVIELQEAERND
jgi:hypothetical protein